MSVPESHSGRRIAYVHGGGGTALLGLTTDQLLRRSIARFPGHEALVSVAQGRRLTFRQLDEEVEQVSRGLIGLGVRPGDHVGVWSTDHVECVLVHLATARIGAVLATINPAYGEQQLLHALRLAEVQVLVLVPRFGRSDFVQRILTLCPELAGRRSGAFQRLPRLRQVVIYDPEDPLVTRPPLRGMHAWPDLLRVGDGVASDEVRQRAAAVEPDDPASLQFTSGTTGRPKCVVLTHHNMVNNGYFVARGMGFHEKDRLCVPVPLFHCFGTVAATLACISQAATIVLPSPWFDAGAALDTIERERCTAVHGVPSMFLRELEQQAAHPRDLSSLRTGMIAGASCPPALVRRIQEELHCPDILIGYGQTECSPVTSSTRLDDDPEQRSGTVGTSLPHQEIKIVDPDTGATLEIGQRGEVCCRGYHVMRGYHRQEAATREAIDPDGWLHTGDVGCLDENGSLRITDRLQDVILCGGESLYPAEIEAVLKEHPAVRAVAVVGAPNPRLDEVVAAWFVLHKGSSVQTEALREHAAARLASAQVPEHIWIVDEFPATVTGKIQKHRIREIAARWLEEQAADRVPEGSATAS